MGWVLKIWRNRHGQPVMREYEDKKHSPEVKRLTYPKGDRRNYYIPGDLVLVRTHTLEDLQKSYPELRRAADEDPSTLESMLEIGLVFLGVDQAKYTTAWRIEAMEPHHAAFQGDGYLKMQRVILLEENTPAPIGPRVHWSLVELDDSWRTLKWVANVQVILDVALFIAETGASFGSAAVLKVIAKKVKRKVAKQLIKRGMRRILRVAVKQLSEAVPRATIAAIKEFAIETTTRLSAFYRSH